MKEDWLCNICHVGVLDPKKKVRASNGLEFIVVCPECGRENPEFSFTADPTCTPLSNITFVSGDVPSGSEVKAFMSASFGPIPPSVKAEMPLIAFDETTEWKRLADVRLASGQLVEYCGVNPECARKEYAAISTVPRKGYFTKDCGTSWKEQLDGFTTEKLGVIVAPDPEITFWRAVDPELSAGA